MVKIRVTTSKAKYNNSEQGSSSSFNQQNYGQQQSSQPGSYMFQQGNSAPLSGYNQAQQSSQTYGQPQPAYQSQQAYLPTQQTGYVPEGILFQPQPGAFNGGNGNQFLNDANSGQSTHAYQSGQNSTAQGAVGYQGFSEQDIAGQPFQPLQAHYQQQLPFQPSVISAQAPAAPRLKQQKTGANIPATRLSFVQAADQQKFEQLFAKAVGPYKTALPGDEAKTILMRSGLSADKLSRIWRLSDTTRSGQLLFPEFVLAMHLCNDALRNGRIPDQLQENIKNEVTSMVDHIAFTAADTSAAPALQGVTNAPNFSTAQSQQQMSNVSLMAQQMQPAQMGFAPLPAQQTGYQQMYPQQTGYQQMQPQQTGYQYNQGLQPGLTGVQQAGLTGLGGMQSNANQLQQNYRGQFPMQALTTQPTGRPGEWGFVHAPKESVQGMQALGAAMMPGAAPTHGQFQLPQQQNQIQVPWAITKEEKAIYDTIFQAWDKKKQGYVEGPVAIEVFGSSGVDRQDLELIWALADSDDKGKLNTDEFAVALHLVYRKLNGYDVPPILPPELIPPSTKNFGDSISQVKNMLQQDASSRNGPTSYMKSRSFKDSNSNRDYSKDGTVYKHNDLDVGYVSSSRRRVPGAVSEVGRDSPQPQTISRDEPREPSIRDLKKIIKEKEVILQAIDHQDESRLQHDSTINRHARKEADDLMKEIRKVQDKIDLHQNVHLLDGGEEREKSSMQRQLQKLVDMLPEVASKVRNVEHKIQEVQMQIWTKQDQKANPGSSSIVGSGPGGQVTEADRRRAKTKAMMAARTAALTGRPAPKSNDDDFEAAAQRQAQKSAELSRLRETNEQMIKDIEESAESLRNDIETALFASEALTSSEHERRRWNDAVGVEPEIREFIHELTRKRTVARETTSSTFNKSTIASNKDAHYSSEPVRASPSPSPVTATEDRAAYLKQAAEARMAERLAALGIRPTKKPLRDSNKPNSQVIAEADSGARERVLLEEQERQTQARLALEERTRREETALHEAQQVAERQRVSQQQQADHSVPPTLAEQSNAAGKSIDNRQAKLAQLRAEREARLAEEERLEKEIAAEASLSDSDDGADARNPNGSIPAHKKVATSSTEPVTELFARQHQQQDVQIDTGMKASASSNNPFHKVGPAATQSAPVPAIPRPPPAAPLVVQRTNAPRPIVKRNNSDDWSVDSKDDESSSDEEGPSPADLAARLFSGGIVPQRTGGAQTPLSAQRTGTAGSPAPNTATQNTTVQKAALVPLPPGSSPPPLGGPPPPPAPPAAFSNAQSAHTGPLPTPSASLPQDRSALLQSIQAGKGLRKVRTVEKGGVSGGRVL
ncbi:Actin cytoskeleton-regulatory complex protein pan-1 [Taphrina deformans PYCC 5710]|uniref:Actin cytoskeleton-regulatory complex protein PAN1 n=1 Tax=Taphrina deformans (strain PYCC 5710 / ATCC 11124 / CBS 356.35 / IMI 108563 / JCM 9778 / NBRC 8474) TaxID=1097556 RepID=R4X6P5_TAPDE|nr:Actin cytoskeleton-regulatory complex protein pan-1 [Taphrina deformans PYCC 5710]|eukprot:CCG80857.1 Actin cytoskeleton-regulatory complex protein pan-1 [Taphrina deformans PYCC 5710]